MAIEGKYVWAGFDAEQRVEHFRFEGSDRVQIHRREQGSVWLFDLRFNEADWKLAYLEILKTADGRETTARYRWDDGAWVGEIAASGERREVCIPMASELEIVIPIPAFEGQFLRRVALPVLSQRRVETVAIDLGDLSAAQSHCIIERLADGTRDVNGAKARAAAYRWTDEFGAQEFVWINQANVALGRADRFEGALRYWLS